MDNWIPEEWERAKYCMVVEADGKTPEEWNEEAIKSLEDTVERIKSTSQVTLLKRYYGRTHDAILVTFKHPPGGWKPI